MVVVAAEEAGGAAALGGNLLACGPAWPCRHAAPLFARQQGPLPTQRLCPCLCPLARAQAAGAFGSGVSSQGGSSGSFESKWVARVRELYRSMPSMRDPHLDLQEMLQASTPAGLGGPVVAGRVGAAAGHVSGRAACAPWCCSGRGAWRLAGSAVVGWRQGWRLAGSHQPLGPPRVRTQDSLPAASSRAAAAGGGGPGTPAASPAAVSQQYLDAVQGSALEGASADEVLAEIEGALAAMEAQVAGGRSPEHVRSLVL